MGQIHQGSKHFALCVYDYGRGIFNSLRNTVHAPRSPVDAITLAIKEGVTRDKQLHQGNGMWGMHNFVRANVGTLRISSGAGFFSMHGDEVRTLEKMPFLSLANNGTTIDFQINFENGIAISDILGGHTPANLRIEALEDRTGNLVYPLNDKASGTGTRRSGLALRTEVLNIANQSNSLIVIDFSGISVVSSSFADEFIGKLVAQLGFISFNRRFQLSNMNPFIGAIIDRAVVQRLASSGTAPAF